MTSVDRIKMICKDRKIPISRLEKDLGFGNAYISQLRKGVLPAERLHLVADYLGVSPDYLMYGNEKKPTPEMGNELSEKDIRLIQWFRSLPQGKQKAILDSQDAPEGLV